MDLFNRTTNYLRNNHSTPETLKGEEVLFDLPSALDSEGNTITFEEIFKKYPNRIIYTPKRTFFGDYKTVEGIQDSVIDLLLGGLNNHIIGTKGSSYCDMQWWFGGAKASVNYIISHPGRK